MKTPYVLLLTVVTGSIAPSDVCKNLEQFAERMAPEEVDMFMTELAALTTEVTMDDTENPGHLVSRSIVLDETCFETLRPALNGFFSAYPSWRSHLQTGSVGKGRGMYLVGLGRTTGNLWVTILGLTDAVDGASRLPMDDFFAFIEAPFKQSATRRHQADSEQPSEEELFEYARFFLKTVTCRNEKFCALIGEFKELAEYFVDYYQFKNAFIQFLDNVWWD